MGALNMDVRFSDSDLERLEADPAFYAGHSKEVVKGFRKLMQAIRAAVDERDLYGMKSFRFEKLKGSRFHQHSLRINIQWRLIVEVIEHRPKNILKIVAIEDYH
jgi:proteic killer suppression protein